MFYRDVKSALLDAYNKANNLSPPIRLRDVTFGNGGVWLIGDCNARVTVNARPGSDTFRGSMFLYYNRQRIDYWLKGMVLPGKRSDYRQLENVLDALHLRYGLSMYYEDFTTYTIPDDATFVTLRPRISAICWTPGYEVSLPLPAE